MRNHSRIASALGLSFLLQPALLAEEPVRRKRDTLEKILE